MEGIILAGGFGTRLKSILDNCPKPMAPINGIPFLEILLKNLSKNGFKRIVLSLYYQADMITSYFKNSFSGMEIVYAIEPYPLGTGGAIKNSFTKVKEDHVYVLNGDTFMDLNYSDIEMIWKKNKLNIVVLKEISDVSRYGLVKVDGKYIKSFSEKLKSGCGLINAGVYILNKDIFQNKKIEDVFSFEKDFLNQEVKNKRILYYKSEGLFIDIGIPEDYHNAQNLLGNES